MVTNIRYYKGEGVSSDYYYYKFMASNGDDLTSRFRYLGNLVGSFTGVHLRTKLNPLEVKKELGKILTSEFKTAELQELYKKVENCEKAETCELSCRLTDAAKCNLLNECKLEAERIVEMRKIAKTPLIGYLQEFIPRDKLIEPDESIEDTNDNEEDKR